MRWMKKGINKSIQIDILSQAQIEVSKFQL